MLFRGSKLKNNNTLLFELVKLKKTKYLYILDWRPLSLDMAKLSFGYIFSELYSLKNLLTYGGQNLRKSLTNIFSDKLIPVF